MTDPNADDNSHSSICRIADRHGFSEDAAYVMAAALSAGGGSMAQFDHPEFGGMGQWSRGGMMMIGDMFNNGLKSRVGGLAEDLAGAVSSGEVTLKTERAGGSWWPGSLGAPSSSGSQNGQGYAVFPNLRRLAVRRDGRVSLHDTGDHHIGGVSQQQGSSSDLVFSSRNGTVRLSDLPELPEDGDSPAVSRKVEAGSDAPFAAKDPVERAGRPPASTSSQASAGGDVIETIRKLAELRDRSILSEEEFAAKKRTLLDRL